MRHIITREEFDKSERESRAFLLENEIINPSKGEKAINDVTRHLSYCLLKNGIMGRQFQQFKRDYSLGTIIDVSFLTESGNYKWLDFVDTQYQGLAKDLFQTRPMGLGTPNAACGEGEFMLFCSSPICRKPTRGDIEVITGRTSKIIELKGDNPRVTSSVPGNVFRRKTLELCQDYELTPNTSRTGGISGVQLTSGGTIQQHWRNELSKLNKRERKAFLAKWLLETKTLTRNEANSSAELILHDGFIDIDLLKKEIIKYFFRHQVRARHEFSNMAFFKNDNVKIITNDVEKFFRLVDIDEIKPAGDYFRLNQNAPLAWYIDGGLEG